MDGEMDKLYEMIDDLEIAMLTTRRPDGHLVSRPMAKLSRDKAIIKQLWAPDWKAWFQKEGDPRHGTPDDPRLVLIGVDVRSAVFLEVDKPQPVVLFELVKGMVTGKRPELGTMHRV